MGQGIRGWRADLCASSVGVFRGLKERCRGVIVKKGLSGKGLVKVVDRNWRWRIDHFFTEFSYRRKNELCLSLAGENKVKILFCVESITGCSQVDLKDAVGRDAGFDGNHREVTYGRR